MRIQLGFSTGELDELQDTPAAIEHGRKRLIERLEWLTPRATHVEKINLWFWVRLLRVMSPRAATCSSRYRQLPKLVGVLSQGRLLREDGTVAVKMAEMLSACTALRDLFLVGDIPASCGLLQLPRTLTTLSLSLRLSEATQVCRSCCRVITCSVVRQCSQLCTVE